MSNLEAPLYELQKMNSPTTSQVRMEITNPPRSPLQSPSPTPRSKRPRSSSSPESVQKRPSLVPEAAPMPEPFEPLLPEPCWGCFSPPKAPSDVASLDDEADIDMLRSPSPSTESDTTQDGSSTTLCKRRKHYLESGMLYVGPKEKGFKDDILTPLGVRISPSQSAGTTPKDIFGEQKSTPKSRVILHMEDDELTEITLDFQQYQRRQYDEHTLSTLCKDSIVPRDRFINAPNVGEDRNITKSVRRDKWKPKKEGPSIPMGVYTFDWDIEPDTTYGVSIRMFDVKDRKELGLTECHPWLAERGAMVCPYLTVGYKCTEKTGKASDATYQNITASVIWLYQRKQIRQALNLALDDLKHFSVTFVDSNFTIWEASFQGDKYYLRQVAQGAATTLDGLKLYVKWNNAIHTWGLGTNAASFKNDIEALLELRRGRGPFPTPPSTHSLAHAPQQSGAV